MKTNIEQISNLFALESIILPSKDIMHLVVISSYSFLAAHFQFDQTMYKVIKSI